MNDSTSSSYARLSIVSITGGMGDDSIPGPGAGVNTGEYTNRPVIAASYHCAN